ncbi:hydroxypyruvate isomerase family protein [Geminisphaera colitermitum]|uniref:hydroxypyruvate isomerase family protein n=1 Tax=Geminisphaera colitermitum TaxID=1148786 RepID=UPI0001965472|nr:TIM barrel protein [Geminisphaera colitermitum]
MQKASFKQSFTWWSFANRGVEPEALLAGAAKIGYDGVELIDEKFWPLARRHGLAIATTGGHGTIENGLNRRENAPRILDELRANIAKAVEWRIPVLICFSGNRHGNSNTDTPSDAGGLAVAAETLSRIAPEAEKAGVTLAVELLNSRVDHAGYQCDRTAWGVRLCEQVNSPAVKLLYDIYHMQVMEGDVIRTIRRDHRWFAHYHTAGNPGRGPLDDPAQELNYPAIFRAIRETGHAGFVGHEFFPAANPLDDLARAHALARV